MTIWPTYLGVLDSRFISLFSRDEMTILNKNMINTN